MSDEINRLRDRVKDLEDRLHERDLAVTALAREVNEAYDRGVRRVIEQVWKYANAYGHAEAVDAVIKEAFAAHEKEAGRE
jgi:hypothetical protein